MRQVFKVVMCRILSDVIEEKESQGSVTWLRTFLAEQMSTNTLGTARGVDSGSRMRRALLAIGIVRISQWVKMLLDLTGISGMISKFVD